MPSVAASSMKPLCEVWAKWEVTIAALATKVEMLLLCTFWTSLKPHRFWPG